MVSHDVLPLRQMNQSPQNSTIPPWADADWPGHNVIAGTLFWLAGFALVHEHFFERPFLTLVAACLAFPVMVLLLIVPYHLTVSLAAGLWQLATRRSTHPRPGPAVHPGFSRFARRR